MLIHLISNILITTVCKYAFHNMKKGLQYITLKEN
jgi:hypothetical protein